MAKAIPAPGSKYWAVPKIWDGDSCAIIGGGPSLAGRDLSVLSDRCRAIAVNCAYKLGSFEAMYFGDSRWLADFGAGLANFAGLKITSHLEHDGKYGIRVIRRDFEGLGISKDPELLYWNKSSGACAINLAVLLGAGRIILLGFDMKRVNGKSNYHTEYQPIDPKFDPFYKFLPPFNAISDDLKKLGIECVNATPIIKGQPLSALEAFPTIDIDEVLSC